MSNAEEALESGEAWHAFCDRLKAAGDSILAPGFPDTPGDIAEGFRYLTRVITYATQMEMEAGDADHPFFIRYELPHLQWGGPNPDNTYLRANVDPSQSYRIWGKVKDMRQAIFSLNEGDMQLEEYGVFSEMTLDDLDVDPDGSLEIFLSPEPQKKNWMKTDPKGRLFTIRIYLSDWEKESSPVFHIERIGAEGVPRPPVDGEHVVTSLDRAANWIEKTATYWNGYTAGAANRSTPNVAGAPGSTPGGADNIKYGNCIWELEPGQALLLETDPPDAQYWGFCLHTLGWLESGDFAERQTSLSGDQVHIDSDGKVRVVVAMEDPGVPNWIDACGRPKGLLVYRWVWSKDNPVPTSKLVDQSALRDELPSDHPVVDEAGRRKALSKRREDAWNRFQ